MQVTLTPTATDCRTNAAFEVMMWALSRPGSIGTLPGDGMLTAAECLLDNECTFHVQDDAPFQKALIQSGARCGPMSDVDYIFGDFNTSAKVQTLRTVRTGTLQYPDNSATLFVSAFFGSGTHLRLTGPGVADHITLAVDGVDPSFWSVRDDIIRYPLGFDVYLVDGDQVVGLPRSTKIEVF